LASYLSKPHCTVLTIHTYGEYNDMFMSTFSLLPQWEFTSSAYLFDPDSDSATDDGYSTSLYAKYMFYENPARTGGASVADTR